MNLGVQRCYNTFEHRMETVPIISLAFKISNKVTIELPLGNLVKHVVEDVVMKKRKEDYEKSNRQSFIKRLF